MAGAGGWSPGEPRSVPAPKGSNPRGQPLLPPPLVRGGGRRPPLPRGPGMKQLLP